MLPAYNSETNAGSIIGDKPIRALPVLLSNIVSRLCVINSVFQISVWSQVKNTIRSAT